MKKSSSNGNVRSSHIVLGDSSQIFVRLTDSGNVILTQKSYLRDRSLIHYRTIVIHKTQFRAFIDLLNDLEQLWLELDNEKEAKQ
jgi:hypothetical protein